MTGDNEKTQPQELLEAVIPHNEDEKFPTIEEQQAYWDEKEKAKEPKPPRRWSAARRRRYNEKKAGWQPVPPPPQEEPVAMIKFCPSCGKNIERFLS